MFWLMAGLSAFSFLGLEKVPQVEIFLKNALVDPLGAWYNPFSRPVDVVIIVG
jgi:hypothetical protein